MKQFSFDVKFNESCMSGVSPFSSGELNLGSQLNFNRRIDSYVDTSDTYYTCNSTFENSSANSVNRSKENDALLAHNFGSSPLSRTTSFKHPKSLRGIKRKRLQQSLSSIGIAPHTGISQEFASLKMSKSASIQFNVCTTPEQIDNKRFKVESPLKGVLKNTTTSTEEHADDKISFSTPISNANGSQKIRKTTRFDFTSRDKEDSLSPDQVGIIL